MMEEGRRGVGLAGDELVEVGLLRGAAVEDKGHAGDACVGREGAEVIGGADVRVERACEGDGRSGFDGAADARSGTLCERETRQQKQRGDSREPSEPMKRVHPNKSFREPIELRGISRVTVAEKWAERKPTLVDLSTDGGER